MRRAGVTVAVGSIACAAESTLEMPDRQFSGGDATVFVDDQSAYTFPAPTLDRDGERMFFKGKALFRDTWVVAPSSTTSRDGLGPVFNARSCETCHIRDGRGRPPEPGEPMVSLFLRVFVDGDADPTYGGQLQPLGVPGLPGEGRPTVTYEEIAGSYADGTPYSLRRPTYAIADPSYGPLAEGAVVVPRIARPLIGLGLLAAIPEADLVSGSGRPSWVWDHAAQAERLGRFGWKGTEATVHDQAALAFLEDMGLTTSVFSAGPCTERQPACAAEPDGGTPELSDVFLENVAFYAATLAVPARRDWDDDNVLRGEALFEDAGCTRCHTPTHVTGDSTTIPGYEGQTIHPYTDLLLHDLGDALADGVDRQWRTPPLWGIGLVETVNGHTFLLHDGRARGFAEAVLWHGGEAAAAKDTFVRMSANDRADLIRFLESL